jgi:hypothetical protein
MTLGRGRCRKLCDDEVYNLYSGVENIHEVSRIRNGTVGNKKHIQNIGVKFSREETIGRFKPK